MGHFVVFQGKTEKAALSKIKTLDKAGFKGWLIHEPENRLFKEAFLVALDDSVMSQYMTWKHSK